MSEENDSFAGHEGVEKNHDRVCETSICVEMWVKRPRDNDRWVRECLYQLYQRVLKREGVSAINNRKGGRILTSPTSSGNVDSGILIGS